MKEEDEAAGGLETTPSGNEVSNKVELETEAIDEPPKAGFGTLMV